MSDNGPEGNLMTMGPPWDNSRIEDWGKKGSAIQYGPAWAQVSAGPLRMYKGFLSEGGIRVPLIVAGNGVGGSARMTDQFAHVTDIPATILDVAGVPYPESSDAAPLVPLQGRSLAPVLSGAAETVRGPSDWTGWELFGNRAIRQGDWKLLSLCPPFGSGDWQLYDLKTDPAETRDLAAERPEIRDELARHWEEYAAANNVILPSASPLCRPQN